MRLKILHGDQVFFFRLQETFCKIDDGSAAQVNFEGRFLDRFPVRVEMESGIGVGAVMHAHADRPKIYALAFRYLSSQPKMKWLVTGPFRQIVRERPGDIPNFHR